MLDTSFEHRYGAIDINMTADPMEALVRIRAAKSDLPILMGSAQTGLDGKYQCQETGANAHGVELSLLDAATADLEELLSR